jgi:hypothetical protein
MPKVSGQDRTVGMWSSSPRRSWWSRWFGPYDRDEALRRLGGPDVNAEQRKKAMNGEQKTFVLIGAMVLSVAAWGFWLLEQYNVETARMRPTTEEIISCMNTCTRSCSAEAMP